LVLEVQMSEPIVRAVDVVKTFGDVHALEGVSLEFEPGIIYGLLGPNGAGKTTLIRVLTTLLKPDSGEAWVAGVDAIHDSVEARTHLGLAGQFAAVDDYLTGRENVVMVARLYNLSRREAEQRADEVLEAIRITDAADRPVRTYSGGMRRRLDLAASMVGRPEVLFLDEPTTGIDPRSRIDIWNLILDLVAGGTTILLTTQYLDEADQLAARIGVIDRGNLITEGTPEELKDRMGLAFLDLKIAEESRGRGMEILQSIEGEEPAFEPGTQRVTVTAQRGSGTLVDAVRRLDAAGIPFEDVTLRKPTLNDVFLSLTGHTADEEDDNNGNGGRRRGRESR
jgi:ABC-2 type transport system ATP-binding protein